MKRDELNRYRQELITLAAALDRGLAHDHREFRGEDEPDVPGGPMPSTEDRSDDGAREVEIGMIANEQHLLAEVNAALERIEKRTFGTCTECGRPIARRRLNAVPYARQCLRCVWDLQPIVG